jgi:hypothetical protein
LTRYIRVNWQCGIDIGAAREKVRVAHALANVPKIAAAMERGQLSYSKVRALTRISTAENEDFLLTLALHGTANQVENVVRYYRRCKEAEELSREARQPQHLAHVGSRGRFSPGESPSAGRNLLRAGVGIAICSLA